MSDYFAGSDWSQTYARKAIPVLVNFAESHRSVTYSELATLLLGDKKYAYPLMSALGRLGRALESLNKAEPRKLGKIPPIQLLVCGQRTGRPGNLALNFLGLRKSISDKMSKQELNSIVRVTHQTIFSYQHWPEVLKFLGLKRLTLKLPVPETVLPAIREIERRRSKAEGDEHKQLKIFLAQNPGKIGIESKRTGDTEQLLLSGDRLDISFRNDSGWTAVEVKPGRSPIADLIRGIFQCIKYRTIMEAQLRYEVLVGQQRVIQLPRVILACGGFLPREVRALAQALDVEVKPGVSVPEGFVC